MRKKRDQEAASTKPPERERITVPLERDESMLGVGRDLVGLIQLQASQVGQEIGADVDELARYTAERAAHLALCVGEPAFEEALLAERQNVALYAAIKGVERAHQVDGRLLAAIRGALSLAAHALVVPP